MSDARGEAAWAAWAPSMAQSVSVEAGTRGCEHTLHAVIQITRPAIRDT